MSSHRNELLDDRRRQERKSFSCPQSFKWLPYKLLMYINFEQILVSTPKGITRGLTATVKLLQLTDYICQLFTMFRPASPVSFRQRETNVLFRFSWSRQVWISLQVMFSQSISRFLALLPSADVFQSDQFVHVYYIEAIHHILFIEVYVPNWL